VLAAIEFVADKKPIAWKVPKAPRHLGFGVGDGQTRRVSR